MRRNVLAPATVFLGFSIALLSSGCGYRPFVGPAGTLAYQRQNATLHDPYPDNDLGPEVVGGRPREFQKPLGEPVRNRWLYDTWWTR